MGTPCLHAPWRMEYIRGIDKADKDPSCFLCQAGAVTDA